MKKHYERVLSDNDDRVKRALRNQKRESESSLYGGFMDENRLVEAKYAIYQVVSMTGAYSNQESKWYQSEQVAESIMCGLSYIARVQHENGLWDYIDCNFFSAPDTAFMIKGLLPALHYLKDQERSSMQETIYHQMYEIGRKAAFGLLQGGFHTPNHRWAIASTLCECADFFDAPELVEASLPYLNEGIDCNADGEYAEKSAGTYNCVNNEAMISLGDYLHEDIYYEYAIRNLHMMLTYIEPDGTIFTANSTRQDNGKRVYPTEYYWHYLRMGKEKQIVEFLDMANYIFSLIISENLMSPDLLLYFMNMPELIDFEYEGTKKEIYFKKFYQESGIIRVGCGDFSYTLMKGKSNFLYFSNKSLDIAFKIGGSLCEHRAFVPENIEETEDGFVLTQTMHGWYYLPFKEKPATSDWWKMENQKRDKVLGPDMEICVQVQQVPDGIDIRMNLTGIHNAPFRVEAAITGAKTIENEDFLLPVTKGGCALAKRGMVRIYNTNDCLEIGPCFGEHAYTAGKFGSEIQQTNGFTLYFTDYTEFKHCIKIRNI